MKESEIIALFQNKKSKDNVIVGIGDDAAVLPGVSDGQYTLVTTDMLIEGTHFLRDQITAEELARKSLAVNLSDIAAMGGKPTYVFLSLAFPKDLSDGWIAQFASAFVNACEDYGVVVVGGDTNQSPNGIVISPTVHGTVSKENLKLRSGAKANDLICVTGNLGDSRAGFQCLQKNANLELGRRLAKKHFLVKPQLAAGLFLGQQKSVTSMMDISDGLVADLPKLLSLSNVSARIDLENIPVSNDLLEYCSQLKKNAFEFAAIGGEDYELLFTVHENNFQQLKKDYQNQIKADFFCVGKIQTLNFDRVSYYFKENPFVVTDKGFEHF